MMNWYFRFCIKTKPALGRIIRAFANEGNCILVNKRSARRLVTWPRKQLKAHHVVATLSNSVNVWFVFEFNNSSPKTLTAQRSARTSVHAEAERNDPVGKSAGRQSLCWWVAHVLKSQTNSSSGVVLSNWFYPIMNYAGPADVWDHQCQQLIKNVAVEEN